MSIARIGLSTKRSAAPTTRLTLFLLIALASTSSGFAQGVYPPRGGGRDSDMPRAPGLPNARMAPGVHVYPPGESIERDLDSLFGKRRAPDGTAGFPSPGFAGQGPRGIGKPFGRPNGEAAKKPPAAKPPTAAERAAKIRKALAPKPPLAFVRRHTLDDLFGKLTAAKDVDEAKGIASLITKIWMRSGSDTADLMMQRSLQALDKKQYKIALDLLDHLVELRPGWAEAWNKRASVRFFSGDLNGAMADVEHVLKLEPKHFGALVGMASILQHTGFEKRALDVYRRALQIYPHQPEIEKIVDKLTIEVEGQGI